MKCLLLIVSVLTLAGCMASPYPIRYVTYELDKDTQQWTQIDCTVNALGSKQTQSACCGPRDTKTVCYKETIPAPPGGAVPLKSDL